MPRRNKIIVSTIALLISLAVVSFDALEHRFNFSYLMENFKDKYFEFPYNYLYADGFQAIASIVGFFIVLTAVIIWNKKDPLQYPKTRTAILVLGGIAFLIFIGLVLFAIFVLFALFIYPGVPLH